MAKSAGYTQGNGKQLADGEVFAQLERILSSSVFIASPSLAQFLQFVVKESLSGRSDRIKAYTIAVNAWGRERDFNPQADPIVRIQAGRLRRALRECYTGEGADFLVTGSFFATMFVCVSPLLSATRAKVFSFGDSGLTAS